MHGGRSAYNHLLCLAQSNGIGRHRVDEVLDLVGLDGVQGRRAKGFSLGMSQRLGLAAALLGDPQVVLCDEPVNGLDPEGIRWIRTLLRGLAAEGRTVFVSSHLMSEMALTADHVIVVGRGRLIADASVADIVAQSARSHVLVRTPDPARLDALLRTAGATVRPGEDGGIEVSGLDCADSRRTRRAARRHPARTLAATGLARGRVPRAHPGQCRVPRRGEGVMTTVVVQQAEPATNRPPPRSASATCCVRSGRSCARCARRTGRCSWPC